MERKRAARRLHLLEWQIIGAEAPLEVLRLTPLINVSRINSLEFCLTLKRAECSGSINDSTTLDARTEVLSIIWEVNVVVVTPSHDKVFLVGKRSRGYQRLEKVTGGGI